LGFVPVFTNEDDPSEFEHLVSAAASLAVHLARAGVPFRFLADDVELAPSCSREHLQRILGYLAEVRPAAAVHDGFVANASRARDRGETLVVVAKDGSLGVGLVIEPHRILRQAS
jgi:uncharacterized protein (DUF58 family)